jgi:D-beta-D-heptose 7-phosphate kinase/D-beta-D-heptose 1-phosphate adenosyltransferase
MTATEVKTLHARDEAHHLRGVLDRLHTARILCVGDIMLDRFVYGGVERVSAEAPIPILRVDRHRSMLGGAGNVARNVVALGAHVELIAVLGDDRAAQEVRDLAHSDASLSSELIIEPGRLTTLKTRFIANGQQLLRTDDETLTAISDETAERVLAAIRSALEDADVMVLSDYRKGMLTDGVLASALAEARGAGVPVIADPKRDDFAAYAGVALLKPNAAELAAATQQMCESDEDVEAAARRAMRSHDLGAMLVTRSARGMTLVQHDIEPVHLPARALEVFDVSGAGDTVLATTAVALAGGADLATASELANVAAGIVVGKLGTATVGRDELATGLLAREVSSSEAKIMSIEAAVGTIDRWRGRGRGLRVGLTNGCFDLLHPGHISLLTEAAASCDRLIVAMNSDESVARLKGPGRPVQSETARALVLASLGVVDMVLVFSEETPIPLLELLKPDVLIKGGDYTIDEVVGADIVQAYGGEVKLANLIPGHSSTRVIARMNGPRTKDEGPQRPASISTWRSV